MEITNQVREYAEKGMAELSEKFEEAGGEIYKESYGEGVEKVEKVAGELGRQQPQIAQNLINNLIRLK